MRNSFYFMCHVKHREIDTNSESQQLVPKSSCYHWLTYIVTFLQKKLHTGQLNEEKVHVQVVKLSMLKESSFLLC